MDEQRQWVYSYTEPPDFTRPLRKKNRLWLHILLFCITLVTTTIAGAFLSTIEPEVSLRFFVRGFSFSIPLLLILGCHEMGHYILSKKHGLDATLPFFIPGPTIIGTFGAVIKIRSRLEDRQVLMDIGIAGPLAGFIVGLPVLIFGYTQSRIIPTDGLEYAGQLGDSLITLLVGHIVYGNLPEGTTLMLHPSAFAGWVGMFVTSLNLLPVGRLDGGHIAYAFFGRSWNRFSPFVFGAVLLMGLFWTGWLVWGILIFFIIKIKHPHTMYDSQELDGKRRLLFFVAVVLLALTFMPRPFVM